MGGGASVGRMWIVAFTLSLVVAALGSLGVVAPGSLGAVAATLLTLTGLYVAAALRIVLGAALFVAAPASRFPRTLRVIGILIVVAGLATPLTPKIATSSARNSPAILLSSLQELTQ